MSTKKIQVHPIDVDESLDSLKSVGEPLSYKALVPFETSFISTDYTTWVSCIAFSPDYSHLAICFNDIEPERCRAGNFNIIKVIEVATGKVSFPGRDSYHNWTTHGRGAYSACFSEDNEKLLTGSIQGDIKLWTRFSGGKWSLCKTFDSSRVSMGYQSSADTIYGCVFLSDQEFITADNSFGITVWRVDTKDPQQYVRSLNNYMTSLVGVFLHPNKERICWGDSSNLYSVNVCDIDETKEDAVVKKKAPRDFLTMTASPCGNYVAVPSVGGVNLYSFYELELLYTVDTPGDVKCMSLSSDGRSLVANIDSEIMLFHVALNRKVMTIDNQANAADVYGGGDQRLAATPDLELMVYCDSHGNITAKNFQMPDLQELEGPSIEEGHAISQTNGLVALPSGLKMSVYTTGSLNLLWEVDLTKPAEPPSKRNDEDSDDEDSDSDSEGEEEDHFFDSSFSHDGRLLVAATTDVLICWDAHTGQVKFEHKLKLFEDDDDDDDDEEVELSVFAIYPHDESIVVVHDHKLEVLDLSTGNVKQSSEVSKKLWKKGTTCSSIKVSHTEAYLAAAFDNKIGIWHVKDDGTIEYKDLCKFDDKGASKGQNNGVAWMEFMAAIGSYAEKEYLYVFDYEGRGGVITPYHPNLTVFPKVHAVKRLQIDDDDDDGEGDSEDEYDDEVEFQIQVIQRGSALPKQLVTTSDDYIRLYEITQTVPKLVKQWICPKHHTSQVLSNGLIVFVDEKATATAINLTSGETVRSLSFRYQDPSKKRHNSEQLETIISPDGSFFLFNSHEQPQKWKGGVVRATNCFQESFLPSWMIDQELTANSKGKSKSDPEVPSMISSSENPFYFAPDLLSKYVRASDLKSLRRILKRKDLGTREFFSSLIAATLEANFADTASFVLRLLADGVQTIYANSNDGGDDEQATDTNWAALTCDIDEDLVLQLYNLSKVPAFLGPLNEFMSHLPLYPAPRPVDIDFDSLHAFSDDETMLVVPSQEWAPRRLWKRNSKTGKDVQPTESLVLPFPNMAGTFFTEDGRRTSFLEGLLNTGEPELFGNIAVRAVIQHKWDSYGAKLFQFEFIIYVICLIVMVALTFVVGDEQHVSDRLEDNVISIILAIILGFFVAWDARHEALQFIADPWKHFSGFWNMLDAVQIALSAAVVLTVCIGEGAKPTLAVAVYLKWLGLLYHLQAFSVTGALVRMILQIIVDIRWFVLVLLIVVLGVANAFHLLLEDEPQSDGFSAVSLSLFTTFNAVMLGSFDTATITVGEYSVLLYFFFVISMLLVAVVLLNLLIALMSDSYERIQDQADVQFQFLRAGILLEQESFFSASDFDDQKKFPKHLHVLLPKGENQPLSAASQWQGVLHAVKNSIHEQMEEHVKVLKEQVRALETQQQSLKKQIVKQDQQRADQFAKIDKLLEGQSTLMKKLGVKANEDTAEESEPE